MIYSNKIDLVMKLVSFDVGIKNMAYCIFNVSNVEGNPLFEITAWNVINLMNSSSQTDSQGDGCSPKCNCELQEKTKTKRNKRLRSDEIAPPLPVCGKNAKYHIGDNKYFCEKHAKNSKYIMFSKEYSQTNLKKLKNTDLISICNRHFIFTNENSVPVQNLTKANILAVLEPFFEKNMLSVIKTEKKQSAGEVNLVTIGRNMKKEFQKIKEFDNVSSVIIENQISPIANRMKTIQGMLAQYFIMSETETNASINIDFISSINKLKGYDLDSISNSTTNEKVKYKQHKNDSVTICSQFLEVNESLYKWKPLLETQKKDDLADCFLQGIWYLKSKNIISNANDLKITNL